MTDLKMENCLLLQRIAELKQEIVDLKGILNA